MEADDPTLVARAAGALDVAEITLFRQAWRHWHGDEPDEAQLERAFVAYMFADVVPPWVRDYARRVLRAQQAGTLESSVESSDGGEPPRAAPNPRAGYFFAALSAAVLTALVVFADAAARPGAADSGCVTPPCYAAPR